MRVFTSEEYFKIESRGTVFIVTPSEDIPFNAVFGQMIKIDGETHHCIGIERTPKWRIDNAPLYAGERIGLLVYS